MRIPSPTSRSGTRVYLSLWDLFWAVVSPVLALYLRDPGIVFRGDWNVLGYYWLFSSGFALVAFVALGRQDGCARRAERRMDQQRDQCRPRRPLDASAAR